MMPWSGFVVVEAAEARLQRIGRSVADSDLVFEWSRRLWLPISRSPRLFPTMVRLQRRRKNVPASPGVAIVIDGFPRNRPQAEFFLESYDIDGVIHLDLPDEEVRRRVMARRLCTKCGMDYNLIANTPRQEGRCDVCGGELARREDDTEHALAARLHDYHTKTDPVLDLFRRKEYVAVIDATLTKDDVQQAIRDKLGLPPYKPENAAAS